MYRIGARWGVVHPQTYHDGSFEFHGHAEKVQARVFTVEMLDFVLRSVQSA